jgi:hypothetical protein
MGCGTSRGIFMEEGCFERCLLSPFQSHHQGSSLPGSTPHWPSITHNQGQHVYSQFPESHVHLSHANWGLPHPFVNLFTVTTLPMDAFRSFCFLCAFAYRFLISLASSLLCFYTLLSTFILSALWHMGQSSLLPLKKLNSLKTGAISFFHLFWLSTVPSIKLSIWSVADL